MATSTPPLVPMLVRERGIHALVLAAASASIVASGGAWPFRILIALGAIGFAAATLTSLRVILDIRANVGDMMLVGGYRARWSALRASQLAALVESVLLLAMAVAAVVATPMVFPWPVLFFGNVLAAAVELVFLVSRIVQERSTRAWIALFERRPADALAALAGVDLSSRLRTNDALLASSAHLMLGQVPEALERLAPHVPISGLARLEDAGIRLGSGDPRPARAVLAELEPANDHEAMRHRELAAKLAIADGQGSRVLDDADAWKAHIARVAPMQADGPRLILAAAAASEGRSDARSWLQGMSRELDDFSYMHRVEPGFWALVERAAGRSIEPLPVRVGAAAWHPFAPPGQDQGELVKPVRARFEMAWPAALPIGVRRSPVGRVMALVGAVMVLPGLLSALAVAMLGAAFGIEGTGFIALASVGLLIASVASGAREWLRFMPIGEGEPRIVTADGGALALSWYRFAPPLLALARLATGTTILLAPLTLWWLSATIAFVAVPIALLLTLSLRPNQRAASVLLAAHRGQNAEVVRLCRRWLRAWVLASPYREGAAVHLGLALLEMGDIPGARASLNDIGGREARFLGAWLAVASGKADTIRHLLSLDQEPFWRLGLEGWLLLADQKPDALVARADEWRRAAWPNRFGNLLRLQVALALAAIDRVDEARQQAAGLNLARFAWVRVFPGTEAALKRLAG